MAPSAPRSPVVLRATVLVLALAAAAWLAVGLRDVRLQEEAIRLLQADPPQPRAAFEKFEAARRWNASRQPEQFAAAALFFAGDRDAAIARLERVLQAEPENRAAWVLLSQWTSGVDPERSAQAARRAAALDGDVPAR